MEMQAAASSNISHVGYDEATQTLHVTFKSGATYEYSGVSKSDYDKFVSASSMGSHFHQHIKSNFGFRKI